MTVPSLAGSLDFFKAFDGFKGTGSYYLGLQGGYNHDVSIAPCRWRRGRRFVPEYRSRHPDNFLEC